MFKIIHNHKVVDILENLIYVRYLKRSKRFVNTDKMSAHGVRGSDRSTVYVLEGAKHLPVENPRVLVVSIDEEEYNYLRDILSKDSDIHNEDGELHQIRKDKIDAMSMACNESIISGMDVLLSDGEIHNFKLTIEDQLNLSSFQYRILKGASRFLFHETGEPVRWFSAYDMKRVIDAAEKHKNKHTTYFNLLKQCIQNMYNVDDIDKVYYGVSLETLPRPKDMKFNLKEYNIV